MDERAAYGEMERRRPGRGSNEDAIGMAAGVQLAVYSNFDADPVTVTALKTEDGTSLRARPRDQSSPLARTRESYLEPAPRDSWKRSTSFNDGFDGVFRCHGVTESDLAEVDPQTGINPAPRAPSRKVPSPSMLTTRLQSAIASTVGRQRRSHRGPPVPLRWTRRPGPPLPA